MQKLRELLTYNSETGKLYWNKNMGGKVMTGNEAGTKRKDGYVAIKIDQKLHYAHRLAFMLYYNVTIIDHIDHIDGDTSNNIITNLRECEHKQNCRNIKLKTSNKTGVKNVHFCKRKNKLIVKVRTNDKTFIAKFAPDEIEKAAACAKEARDKHHGEFANHG